MKLAVLKLGARIVFGSKVGSSGGSGEAASLIEMLVEGGCEVDCYTKVLSSDVKNPSVNIYNIEDHIENINSNNYDSLIVINGAVNFFGGQEDKPQILNYKAINQFNGKVIYLYCDPNLTLKQIWPSIEKKPWASNWKKEDIEITKSIHVISQSYNLEKNKALFEKNGYEVPTINQYDFQKFPMMKPRTTSTFGKTIDLSYGGTFRSGRREKKLIEFYFGHPEDISVEVFGKIKITDFNEKKIAGLRPPKFTPPVDYNAMVQKMSASKSHIAIGDNQYPDFEMISQRVYESIIAGTLLFVDSEFDKNKRIFGHNSDLKNLLYIDNRKQFSDRLKMFSEKDFNDIIELQYSSVDFDKKEYCTNFVNLLGV